MESSEVLQSLDNITASTLSGDGEVSSTLMVMESNEVFQSLDESTGLTLSQ